MKITRLFATAAMLLCLAMPGCKLFQTACDKAMPVLVQGQAYGQDAAAALDAAQAYAAKLPLSAEQRAKLDGYFDDARAGLEIAAIAIQTGASACTATSPVVAFATFIDAFGKIESIIGAIGLLGAHPGHTALRVPAIVLAARAGK